MSKKAYLLALKSPLKLIPAPYYAFIHLYFPPFLKNLIHKKGLELSSGGKRGGEALYIFVKLYFQQNKHTK